MAHHIGGREPADGNALHAIEHLGCFHQAAELVAGQIDLAGVAGHHHAGVFAQAGQHHAHLRGGGVLGLIEDHKRLSQGAAAHVGQRRHFDDVFLDQGRCALRAQQAVQRVIERPQIGVHLLLQVTGQKAQALTGFHRRSGEDDPLHLALLQAAHRLHHRQKGFAGAGRAQRQGEVVALHRLDVLLLPQGARAQQFAVLAAGQHLLAEVAMLVAAAGVEGLQAGLDVHLGDGLALTPKRAQQFHQARGALHLAGAAFNKQLQSPQHEIGAG